MFHAIYLLNSLKISIVRRTFNSYGIENKYILQILNSFYVISKITYIFLENKLLFKKYLFAKYFDIVKFLALNKVFLTNCTNIVT